MSKWIIGGQIWDPQSNSLQRKEIKIADGRIEQICNPEEASPTEADEVIRADGKLISPGFIDMHVHLREPGFEHKETIASGTLAAAKGGFTTVACMPNTNPVTGDVETIQYVLNIAKEEGAVEVLPYAAITVDQKGETLTDFAALKEAGAIGFTDDGVGVQNAFVMKEAMKLAASLDVPIVAHCEENSLLAPGAAVTEGKFAEKHGLIGIPNESESIHVARDILLAEATGVHYHVCHVSTAQSVRLIRDAKAHGIRVTAEVCPHHLILSDEDIPSLDANWKMNPPLRSPQDVQAVIEGLEDGTIDFIVTDHAPHSAEEKALGLEKAPFGITGFETAFPLLYTHFVKTGRWTLDFLLKRMTEIPAQVFRLDKGRLVPGAAADLTVIDLEMEQEVDPSTFLSKGKNTPFTGWKLQGWPVLTFVAGNVVWSHKN